jgi:hypothetical protein
VFLETGKNREVMVSTQTSVLVLGGVASVAVAGVAIYYYQTQWAPYRNPPAVIKKISQMFQRVSPGAGSIPIKEGGESYTMNKANITLCIRDPRTGKQYSWNTLAYVALHELAHVSTRVKEKDPHGPVFKRNFKDLLNRAEQLGYYNSQIPIPDTYCST